MRNQIVNRRYIQSFIIGSSWLVFIWYFMAVAGYDEGMMNYGYKTYSMIAPLALGLLNVFGLYLARRFDLTSLQRFILTGLIGATIVSIFITYFKIYNFPTRDRWIQQYIALFIVYIFVFAIVINTMEDLLVDV